MKNLKSFLNTLKKDGVELKHEASIDSIVVREEIEGFELEFKLSYNTNVLNYRAPTYDQPEECDIEFENTNHEDIILYQGEDVVELTNNELHSIDSILEDILYNL